MELFLEVIKKFSKNKLNIFASFIVIALILIALGAPLIANHKPILWKSPQGLSFPALSNSLRWNQTDFQSLRKKMGYWGLFPLIPYSYNQNNLDKIDSKPSSEHLFGTDDTGRDVLSRMLFGARTSLMVGFIAAGVALSIGILVGSFAGYFAGKTDLVLMRIIEIVECFPVFFLILTMLALLNPGLLTIMMVIGLFGWTGIARLLRGECLKLRNQDFITAARALGVPPKRILCAHVLPNALPPVLVTIAFHVAGAILTESALSFLGFGVQPPTPSWGGILSSAQHSLGASWWLTFFPGSAIFITVLAYNLVGEGLRDAIDPHLQ